MESIVIDSTTIKFTHDIYEATIITENKHKKLRPLSLNNKPFNRFSIQGVTANISKIYVVKNPSDRFVYIGKTRQPIHMRLNQGLNAPRYAYHWREKDKLKIHCISIPQFSNEQIEATEAELVYVIRRETGKWPLHQTEIHFSNDFPITNRLAEAFYSLISTK